MNPANVQTKATHIEGFVTDAGCTVDIFALDYDRCTGAQKARVLAVGVGAGGANPIGRWRWDAGDLPFCYLTHVNVNGKYHNSVHTYCFTLLYK